MTVWSDTLAEAIAASEQSGDVSGPTSLLNLSNSLDNPLATLGGRDTNHEIFAALDEDLGFVRNIRSSKLTIPSDLNEKLASSIRWLIGMVSDWRRADDPARARLVAMIAVAARLDENGALWLLMPDTITPSHELGHELQSILGGLQFRVEAASFSRSPVVDSEQLEEFRMAEAEKNWPVLRSFAENIPWHFHSNVILDQSVRLLNRFFPSHLVQVGRAVSQLGVAMQMITAIQVDDAFKIALQTENDLLQFAAVCRLFALHHRVPAGGVAMSVEIA